jgi:hypothetical protein
MGDGYIGRGTPGFDGAQDAFTGATPGPAGLNTL